MAYEILKNFCIEKVKETAEGKIKNFQEFFDGFEEVFRREGFREKFSGAVENILIVRLDVVGDFVLTTGFIREVRKNFPSANITLIVSPIVYPIAELCPYVNEVLKFDGKAFRQDIFEVLKKVIVFCSENLWKKHFDISFNPQYGGDNLGGLWVSYLSGANKRTGYGAYPWENFDRTLSEADKTTLEMDYFFLNLKTIAPNEFVSEVEKNFYVLLALDLPIKDSSLELWFGAEDFLQAKNFLKNIPPYRKKIILGIGAGEDSRKYPVEKLLVALKEIAKKNVVFIIVGGKSEKKSADFLEENLPRESVLNLAGKTTLRETEAIIGQADFYIGNATGVMHMSAASKLPVLSIDREAIDEEKENYYAGFYSGVRRFPPYQVPSVILRPDHALDDCANVITYSGCIHKEAHCITQIDPAEIVEGFAVLENLTTEQS